MNELVQTALVWALVSCSPAPVCAEPESMRVDVRVRDAAQDAWLGSDKFTHAGMSWAATALAFGAGRAAGLERDDALLIAAPGALALGLAKELRDSRRTFFSVPDLLADATGVAAAYFFLREVR